MKNILSVIVLTLAFLFTSVNQTQAGRLGMNKNKDGGKRQFVPQGFVFQPLNGIKFAVVDDGQKFNIFYSGEAVISIVCAEKGADVSISFDDGKKGTIRIEEVKLSSKRNKVLAQKITPDEMKRLEERFPEE